MTSFTLLRPTKISGQLGRWMLLAGLILACSVFLAAQEYASSKRKPQGAPEAQSAQQGTPGSKGQADPKKEAKANPGTAPAKDERKVDPRAASVAAEAMENPGVDYTIGEQDVLTINVWKEPDLSVIAVVRPDGKITLPLINDIYVIGLTTTQLQALLTEKLKPFLTVPQVTIGVREINSRKVYVIGQVAREGSYRVNSTSTVLQLIAEAGGLRDFANRKKIYVLRNENGKQLRLPFNYDEVIQGKNYRQNIVLKPGDTLVVP